MDSVSAGTARPIGATPERHRVVAAERNADRERLAWPHGANGVIAIVWFGNASARIGGKPP